MKKSELRKIIGSVLREAIEYPEDPWVKVAGYIKGFSAIPDKEEMFEDGLQDAISEEIYKLQDVQIEHIEVREVGKKSGNTVFEFVTEFIFYAHPNSEIQEGVYSVVENIPYILSNPKPQIDASTDLGGFDRPVNENDNQKYKVRDKLMSLATNGAKQTLGGEAGRYVERVMSDRSFMEKLYHWGKNRQLSFRQVSDLIIDAAKIAKSGAGSNEYSKVLSEDGQPTSTVIDGRSKQSALNWLYKKLTPITAGFFKDDHWEPIQNIRKFMGEQNIQFTIMGSDYQTSKDAHKYQKVPGWRPMPDSKVWKFQIKFENNKQKPSTINGMITAHGAGSTDDPLSRYDVTVVMS